MILPDGNVLLYAFRTDSQQHEQYRGWLEEVVNGEAAYGMAPQVLGELDSDHNASADLGAAQRARRRDRVRYVAIATAALSSCGNRPAPLASALRSLPES